MYPYFWYASRIVSLYHRYISSVPVPLFHSLCTHWGMTQRRIDTLSFGLTVLASAASWKPGERDASASSSRVRIVAGSAPVEVLVSEPISILTWLIRGLFPPNRTLMSCQYRSGCSAL